jgi:hypothetical protein
MTEKKRAKIAMRMRVRKNCVNTTSILCKPVIGSKFQVDIYKQAFKYRPKGVVRCFFHKKLIAYSVYLLSLSLVKLEDRLYGDCVISF